MSAPTTRGKAIDAFCRSCIHDSAAMGTWREQVAACPQTSCPLWQFRPIQDARSAPVWIKCRDPSSLPDGFIQMEQGDAVRAMRADIAAGVYAPCVQAGQSACDTPPATPLQGQENAASNTGGAVVRPHEAKIDECG